MKDTTKRPPAPNAPPTSNIPANFLPAPPLDMTGEPLSADGLGFEVTTAAIKAWEAANIDYRYAFGYSYAADPGPEIAAAREYERWTNLAGGMRFKARNGLVEALHTWHRGDLLASEETPRRQCGAILNGKLYAHVWDEQFDEFTFVELEMSDVTDLDAMLRDQNLGREVVRKGAGR